MSSRVLERNFTPFEIWNLVHPATGDWGTTSYQRLQGAFRGFIWAVSGSEIFRDGKNGEAVKYILTTYNYTPIRHGDKIVQSDKEYFVIYSLPMPEVTGRIHHKEIALGVFE